MTLCAFQGSTKLANVTMIKGKVLTKGQTVGAGILVSYFSNRKDADRALRALGRRRFFRAALVHKTADRDVHIQDPFLWRRGLAATLVAILFGVLAGSASLAFDWSAPILGGTLSPFILILASALIGALVGGVWTRRSKYGIKLRLLEDHARWLVSEETCHDRKVRLY
jgi:hypothetical protein